MNTDLASEARKAVLRQLLTAAKAWSALEERYSLEDRLIDAEGAHVHGMWVLRAHQVEMDDPEPEPMPVEPMANHWFRDRTHSHIASTYCECHPEPVLAAADGELVYIHGSRS